MKLYMRMFSFGSKPRTALKHRIEGSGLFGTDSKINFFFRFFAVTRDQIN